MSDTDQIYALSRPLLRSERQRIVRFNACAAELLSNCTDYRAERERQNPASPINPHRCKSLFVDFRCFVAKREEANFRKFVAFLRPRCRRVAVHRHLDAIESAWEHGEPREFVANMAHDRLMMQEFNRQSSGEFRFERTREGQRGPADQPDLLRYMVDAILFRARLVGRTSAMVRAIAAGHDELILPVQADQVAHTMTALTNVVQRASYVPMVDDWAEDSDANRYALREASAHYDDCRSAI